MTRRIGTLLLAACLALTFGTAQSRAQDQECARLTGAEQAYCRSFLRGDFAAARQAAEQIKADLEAKRRTGTLDYAKALFQLAKPLLSQGHVEQARTTLQQALAIVDTPGAAGSPQLRTLLEPDIHGKLGEALDRLGNCPDATARLNSAVDLWQRDRPQNLRSLAYAHNSLSRIHQSLGRYELAETGFERAIADAEEAARRNREVKREVAVYRNNLARLNQLRGQYDRMLEQANRALAVQNEVARPDDPDFVQTLVAIASALRNLPGRAAEGLPQLKRALALAEGPSGRPALVAAVLVAYANTNVVLGRHAEADQQFQRAIEIREKALGRNHPLMAPPLDYLAQLKLQTGAVSDAIDLSRRTAAIAIERLTKGTNFVCSEDVSLLRAYFNNHLSALDRAIEQRVGGPDLEVESFETAQWANGSTAAVAVARMAARFGTGNDADALVIREQQDDWMRRRDLEKALFVERSKRLAEREARREAQLREAIGKLDERLQKVDHLVGTKPLTPEEAQGLIGRDEVLVFHHVSDQQSYVFAVTREGYRRKAIPIGAAEIARKVAEFRQGLDFDVRKDAVARAAGKNPGGKSLFDLARAHEMHTLLLGPVADLLADKRSILFVPSGALTALPFHLLVTAKPAVAMPVIRELRDFGQYANASWLMKTHAVTVLPSVGNLKALRVMARRSQGAKAMVGFADPVFQRGAAIPAKLVRPSPDSLTRAYSPRDAVDIELLSKGLDALPETADEVRKVAASLGAGSGDLYLGRAASETVVKRADLRQYRVVYFATHGLTAGQVQRLDEPALVLSLPAEPTEEDDGLLKASEVARLKLDADWVVLSACNTAAGEKAAGGAISANTEALSGLARAFFYAGARALLVTHWEAYSDTAATLASRVFEMIRDQPGLGRAEALRRAMLEQIQDTSDPTNAYPEVWAPFQFIGAGSLQ